MPFCANCGSPVDGRFCAKCGNPVSPAGAPPVRPLPAAGLTDNVACALAYTLLLITGVLFLVLEPYSRSRTIRFHAFQAIFLGVAWFGIAVVASIVFGLVRLYFLLPIIEVAFVVLWIYMIVTTYQGRTTVLPVIGPLAQQQAGSV